MASTFLRMVVCTCAFAAVSSWAHAGALQDLVLKDIRYLPRTLTETGDAEARAIILVDSTCGECTPALAVAKELEGTPDAEGVTFLLVNTGVSDDIRQMAYYALINDVPFFGLKDRNAVIADQLGVTSLPAAVLVGKDWEPLWHGTVDALGAALAARKAGMPLPEVSAGGSCAIAHSEPLADSAPVDYSKDIAPLLNQHCVACHRPNGGGPFSLTSYKRATAHADMLAEVVQEGRMPPWYAHEDFGTFRDQPNMTDAERTLLARWVAQGMPEGDPDAAPETPEFNDEGWRLDPDVIIEASEVSAIPAKGFVPYQYIFLPYTFEEDTYVQAIEIKPSNPSVVHHANLAYVHEGYNVDQNSDFLTGMVPGGMPSVMDGDRAWMIPKGVGLVLQIHHVTTGKIEMNRMSVGLRFPRDVVNKRLYYHNLDGDARIDIPPHARAWKLEDSVTLDEDATGLGLFTHMHLRGRDMTFYAKYPDGRSETLLSLPNYDFNWQLTYRYPPDTAKFPKGTEIDVVAHYDNSRFNPYNPDPEKEVKEGPQSVDEMMNGFFVFTKDSGQLGLRIDPATGHVLERLAAK
ncbi:MAG: alkyl hydroperoxide reductase [Candidatus Hydrogenedens sp.]|nr:alkyl hydroperoxide reductase [Candidatus Hydrogenedens sp.]